MRKKLIIVISMIGLFIFGCIGAHNKSYYFVMEKDREGDFYIGEDLTTNEFKRPNAIYLNAGAAIILEIYDIATKNRSSMTFIADSGNEYIYIDCAEFYPVYNNRTTLGKRTKRWSDIYSDNLTLYEVNTPPKAEENFGRVYTKSDHKLYFKDSVGIEHEIAFVQ